MSLCCSKSPKVDYGAGKAVRLDSKLWKREGICQLVKAGVEIAVACARSENSELHDCFLHRYRKKHGV